MTVPIWLSAIIVSAVVGALVSIVKLIFNHDRRIGRLEAWRENFRNNKAE